MFQTLSQPQHRLLAGSCEQRPPLVNRVRTIRPWSLYLAATALRRRARTSPTCTSTGAPYLLPAVKWNKSQYASPDATYPP